MIPILIAILITTEKHPTHMWRHHVSWYKTGKTTSYRGPSHRRRFSDGGRGDGTHGGAVSPRRALALADAWWWVGDEAGDAAGEGISIGKSWKKHGKITGKWKMVENHGTTPNWGASILYNTVYCWGRSGFKSSNLGLCCAGCNGMRY